MKLTFEALEVLDAIDRKGSFAAAAATLHRVPSTITYTVQKLEEDLGLVIFRREGRRSILTPAGRVLLEQGRELLLNAERVVESVYQVNSGWESSINIALDTVWDARAFYPLIAEFHQLNTGVEVNLLEEVMGGSLEALVENRADIVVGGPAPVLPMKEYKFEPILRTQWQFVVGRNHPLAVKQAQDNQSLTEGDIKDYPSIVIRDSSRSSAIRSHRVFDSQLKVRVPSMQHKLDAISQGLGVGFLPSHKIQRALTNGDIVALEIDWAAPDFTQYCSWKINNKGKAMRWFIDKIMTAADLS